MFKKLISGFVLAACVAPAFAAVEWMTDLEAAKKKAAAENKAVLLDFTGSDWCGWCIRIRNEVFDQPRFAEFAQDKFVSVEIDVPNNPNFSPELRRRNEQLCKQYGIEGFPTIMVTDSRGVVAGGFVGGIVDPAKVEAILSAGLENARKLEAAQKLSGEEKAKALAAVYIALPEEMKGAAAPILEEIRALDPNDVSGLAQLARIREQKAAFRQGFVTAKDEASLLKFIEDSLAVAYPENRSMLLNVKGQVLMNMAETEEDIIAARTILLEAYADNPTRRSQIEKSLSNPAAVLKNLKAFRAKRAK